MTADDTDEQADAPSEETPPDTPPEAADKPWWKSAPRPGLAPDQDNAGET
jgi:hypothetical protein